MEPQLPVTQDQRSRSASAHGPSLLIAAVVGGLLVSIVGVAAYSLGARQRPIENLSQAVLHATATHGGTNLAVATGLVSEEAEGIFILDFLTGNLQCWVFYPRLQQFGAKFETNIGQQLPVNKNAEYLLVTGAAAHTQTSGNARPANCVVYVVDARSGMFAGYSLPWNRSAETSLQPQKGLMFCVGGDQFRPPAAGASAVKKPAPTKETGKEKGAPAK